MGRSTRNKLTFPEIPSSIEDTADQVTKNGGVGIPVACDFTVDAQVKQLFEKVKNEKGKVDLLVNSAWGGEEIKINNEPFWKYPPDLWHSPFWTNYAHQWEYAFNRGVRNYLAASCHAVPLMVERKSGLIVNVSYWEDDTYLGELFYDLAKSTMNRLAFGMANELRDNNITVIAVAPGFMKTEVVMASISLNREAVKESFGMPTQTTLYVGRAIAALAKDKNVAEKSGKTVKVSALAKEYGFVDLDGTQP